MNSLLVVKRLNTRENRALFGQVLFSDYINVKEFANLITCVPPTRPRVLGTEKRVRTVSNVIPVLLRIGDATARVFIPA